MSMPKKITYLLQRRASSQQTHGPRMADRVGSLSPCVDAYLFEPMSRDRVEGFSKHRSVRSFDCYEKLKRITSRSYRNVFGDGLGYIEAQRIALHKIILRSPNCYRSLIPIKVSKLESGHFATAKSIGRHNQQCRFGPNGSVIGSLQRGSRFLTSDHSRAWHGAANLLYRGVFRASAMPCLHQALPSAYRRKPLIDRPVDPKVASDQPSCFLEETKSCRSLAERRDNDVRLVCSQRRNPRFLQRSPSIVCAV